MTAVGRRRQRPTRRASGRSAARSGTTAATGSPISCWGPRKIWGFLWLRLSRIWPLTALMLVVWGVAADGLQLSFGKRFDFGTLGAATFLEHLLLVQSWFGTPRDWNSPDWSLSAEMLAYLVF